MDFAVLFTIAQLVPWYLFPGTASSDTVRKTPVETKPQVTVVTEKNEAATDSLKVREFILDIPQTINVCLAMPLGGSVPGNVDFYCGALLAARDLGREGISINLHAHDSGTETIGAGLIATSDVFIGPVSFNDVLAVASQCPDGKTIISPLEQKVSSLTDSLRIVQTPVRTENQKRNLARWASEDMIPGTSLVVILENESDNAGGIIDELDKTGVQYSRAFGYSDLAPFCKEGFQTRFISGSDKEWFNSGVVRAVSVLALELHDVTLFCPSKVRNYENLNVELLHNANAHITTNYYVDYDSPEVRAFVYSYRALFKAEPNSFAFHGYDTINYFTKLCSIYGRDWFMKLGAFSYKGLQSDFDFSHSGAGAINHACRRIIYNSDFTISVR